MVVLKSLPHDCLTVVLGALHDPRSLAFWAKAKSKVSASLVVADPKKAILVLTGHFALSNYITQFRTNQSQDSTATPDQGSRSLNQSGQKRKNDYAFLHECLAYNYTNQLLFRANMQEGHISYEAIHRTTLTNRLYWQ